MLSAPRSKHLRAYRADYWFHGLTNLIHQVLQSVLWFQNHRYLINEDSRNYQYA